MKPIAGGQYRPLTEEGVRKIHDAALTLLAEVGVEVNSARASEAFRHHGASVDNTTRVVKIPRAMVEEAINRAPKGIVLCGREEKHDLYCTGSNVYMGTGGVALSVIDLETDQKRPSTLRDLAAIARLCDALENVHFIVLPVYPNDVEAGVVDVNRFYAAISNCSKHVMGGMFTLQGVRDTIRMAEMIAGGAKALRQRPFISFITCVMSPLKIDETYGEILCAVAEAGVPLAIPAEPLSGATGPVTIAGMLAGIHAETLSGLVLAQLVNPGTPVLYACTASSTDLRTMGYTSGSVEMGLINAGAAQMAQFLKLPNYTTAGMSDSKVVDAQNGYEKATTDVLVALAGSNFIHDAAGLTEFALTASYKQYVIDNEIIGMAMRAVQGIEVTDETVALDAYRRVGPGGNFLTDPHTSEWMRKEHFIPKMSNRQMRAQWEQEGRPSLEEKARAKAREILKSHKPLGIPEDLDGQLRRAFPQIRA